MFELLILGFVFFIGYQIGQIVSCWQLRELIIKDAKREGIIDDNLNIIKRDGPSVHKLIVEKMNNTFYLYDHEAKSFVCQAKTIEELALLAKKYKNIEYAAVMDVEGDAVYKFINGKVEAKL